MKKIKPKIKWYKNLALLSIIISIFSLLISFLSLIISGYFSYQNIEQGQTTIQIQNQSLEMEVSNTLRDKAGTRIDETKKILDEVEKDCKNASNYSDYEISKNLYLRALEYNQKENYSGVISITEGITPCIACQDCSTARPTISGQSNASSVIYIIIVIDLIMIFIVIIILYKRQKPIQSITIQK